MIFEVENGIVTFKASTKDVLFSLSNSVRYCNLLLAQKTNETYLEFLQKLIDNNFYHNDGERLAIKKLAAESKIDPSKIRKWILQIYEDIFKLNHVQSHLFRNDGISVKLYFTNHNAACTFYMSLPVIPREHETFVFHFINAKMGTEYFWVKKVEHYIENDIVEIVIELQGGFENKYREFVIDKALFQNKLDIMSAHKFSASEMDKELNRIYRD